MIKEKTVTLDVRPILATGVDPFEEIMKNLKVLKDDETLLVVNTFEPVPLIMKLKNQGYSCEVKRPEDGTVHTYLTKISDNIETETSEKEHTNIINFEDALEKFKGKITEVDVRPLEMPLPMVTILEEVEKLKAGEALFVFHKRLPQYLLPELEKRGYNYVSKEKDENNINFIIFK